MGVMLFTSLLTLSAKDYKYTTVQGDPMQTRIYTLDNGLKVYLSVNAEKPRIAAHIAVNTGSRNDPADCTGLAHYLEHLIFKGSHKFGTSNYEAERPLIQQISDLYEEYRKLTDPAERKAKYHEIDSISQLAAQYNIPNEYDKLMAAIGSQGTNAFTSNDITCYTEDIPSNEVERWAEIQADRFQNLVLRGFHTELEAVYEEKNIGMAQDSRKIIEAMNAKLYPSHSYGTQTTIGTQEHLKNPSMVEIQKYYNRYYRPNNVAICMAGDMDPDKVIAIIDREFGSWQPGNDIQPRQFPEQPRFVEPQDTTVMGLEAENLILAWRFDGTASMQNDTLQVLSSVLYNGRAGLIDLNVNQKMALQEGYSYVYNLKDYSALMLGATPNAGQSLDEARDVLLAEIEKLKKGEFDDDLLMAINNNNRRAFLMQLDDNESRVSAMAYSFVNGETWENNVRSLDRQQMITKADVVAFARKYLDNGYVYVKKEQGEDTSVKKIEKPEITPIPTNRDMSSDFLKQMASRTVEPIQPRFDDYNRDLTKATTKDKQQMLYVQNKENDLFTLAFLYDFGDRADVRYSILSSYLDLLDTKKFTNEELKKRFYNLACDYNVSVSNRRINVSLSGLNKNLPAALVLLDEVLNNSKADAEVYNALVDQVLKERMEAKQNQQQCFNFLYQYGLHGAKNDYTNMMSEAEMRSTSPQTFVDLAKSLSTYKYTVLYYGPSTVDELSAAIAKNHKTAKKLADVPVNKEFEWTQTPQSEIIIAPYKANNIYMRMINNEAKPLALERRPVIRLFNEYFGGSMNAIVFQELRESRGLAYNASAYYNPSTRTDEPEFWFEHIISQNDKMIECINTFKEITDDMPQSETAFEIAKNSVMKTLASERTTKFDIISNYLISKDLGVDYDLNRVAYESIPNLKLADIVRFEQQSIKGKPLRYVILGDENELDIPALEKIAPVKRVTLEEIFGY